MQTVEAIIDKNGTVRLLGDVRLPKVRRALVTILDEEPIDTFVSGLEPAKDHPKKQRTAGLNKGMIWASDDFDAPLPDEFWLGDK
ncbi:MAG: hypothetical protein IT173_08710 [Acidobacteria bacterium]|nr:hypothetical protein [Acidobacteriota bacterium]